MLIRKLLAIAAMGILAACGAAPDPQATTDAALSTPENGNGNGHGPIGVMSRNLYLGAALDDVIAAATPAAFLAATSRVWAQVVTNDAHERMQLVADEIAMNRPDVVGLQEAYLWRKKPVSQTAPATDVVYDYIGDLLAALQERGTPYEVRSEIQLFDFVAPAVTPAGPIGVRMTDRQAILVRKGTEFQNPRGQLYSVLLPLTIQLTGQTIYVLRGWTAIDVNIGGEWLSFLNTHTESFYAPVTAAQGMELAGILGATSGKAILVGDLNSTPGTLAAASVAAAGFTDSWADLHGKKPGLTCCFPESLTLTTPGLYERIDYVFVRDLKPLTMKIVGAMPFDHRSGLWPSDHAGVVATAKPERGMWAGSGE